MLRSRWLKQRITKGVDPTARLIIIYAGDYHSENVRAVLKAEIADLKTLTPEEEAITSKHRRCISMRGIKQPFFGLPIINAETQRLDRVKQGEEENARAAAGIKLPAKSKHPMLLRSSTRRRFGATKATITTTTTTT